ncbi:amidohydrolase family protein [Nonomuraea africana]|uniref:Cytosine/adenosine deaminase-related metal-dependent hydrolase n=1 Tax=Nonomuraea africana TaxID=46171 RepID=A0ABR9K988_9ACTN|nr:cytosine/adenosine deaminase-related metal-dependent hydrolase [Nonomuraea africana]
MGSVSYSAPLVLPISGPAVRDGRIVVREGRIEEIGTGRGEIHYEGILVAGLVNAHTHLQYTAMAEIGRHVYASFEDWARAFDLAYFGGEDGSWNSAHRESAWDWAAGAIDGAWECLRTGTTAAADIVTDPEALVDTPLGGLRYLEAIGDSEDSWREGGRERFLDLLAKADAISPHAPYSLDTGVLADLARLAAERGMRTHIHLSESVHEREFTMHGSGPLEQYVTKLGLDFTILREHGAGLPPTAYIDSTGLLGPGCHIAHGVDLTAEDRALLRERRTAVALCPRSNHVLGLPGPDVAALLREGNPIAVGTDSLSSSPSLDLLADVAALRELAVRQGYREPDLDRRLIEAATLGGARAMGLEHEIGSLTPGHRADFAVFDLDPSSENPYRALAEHGAGRCVATVVGGSPLTEMT